MHVGVRKRLTAAQEGIWYAQAMQPENPAQNMAEYLLVTGPLRLDALERAVGQAVEEAEGVRARFGHDDDGLWQAIGWPGGSRLQVVDLCGEADPVMAAEAWMRADVARAADLENDPLLMTAALLVDADRTVVYIRVHHIAMDHAGYGPWLERVAQVYSALEEGRNCPLVPFASVDEVLADDQSYRASAQFAADRAFWAGQMAGAPVPVTLAGKTAPTPGLARRQGEVVAAEVTGRLRRLARGSGVALPALLFAAAGMYLQRMAGVPRPQSP